MAADRASPTNRLQEDKAQIVGSRQRRWEETGHLFSLRVTLSTASFMAAIQSCLRREVSS